MEINVFIGAIIGALIGWLVHYTRTSFKPLWPNPNTMPFHQLRGIYFHRCQDEGHDYMGRD